MAGAWAAKGIRTRHDTKVLVKQSRVHCFKRETFSRWIVRLAAGIPEG